MAAMHARFVFALTWCFAAGACSSDGNSRDQAAIGATDGAPSGPPPSSSTNDGAGGDSATPPTMGADAPGPEATSTTSSGSPAPQTSPSSPTASEPLPSGTGPEETPPVSGSAGSGGAGPGGAGPVVSPVGGGGTLGSAGESTQGGDGSGGTPSAGAPSVAGAGGTSPNEGEPRIHYVGRFNEDSEAMRFEWSGSGVVAAFEGDSVSVLMEDAGGNEFTVLIDGELRPKLVLQGSQQYYELATGLAFGVHTVELYRRTEASFGASGFQGFDFGGGTLLPPPTPPSRKLEIIGDSITCGYGNEGDSATCGFSADTENHYATYGAIAARALDAEVVTIAWSGKGIVYNYDTDTNQPLPELYDRILPQGGGPDWDFSVIPDAVVINLGTNDFSTEGDPTPELFTGRYVEFLTHLRDVYPTTYILCTVGPLLSGGDLEAARSGIADAVATRQSAGDDRVDAWEMNVPNDDPGCDYHPGLETHQAMADALVPELRQRLGW